MRASLDSHELFEGHHLEVKPSSIRRAVVERGVAGLNGVISIDFGLRSRKIKQVGTLSGRSGESLDNQVARISSYIDGDTHTLSVSDGCEFDNLRMDSFEVSGRREMGSRVVVDYKVTYTQLKV